MAGDRDYNAAITALNSLQSNFSVVQSIRKDGKARNKRSLPEMFEWLKRIGYEPSDLNQLNAIHIAGTKGKGSTSAFISSILCQYASDTPSITPTRSNGSPKYFRKIGLFTSPHLQSVRERIQINNEPLSEPMFARYFFQVWDRLEAAAEKLGPPPTETPKPMYFRYLTLMAMHTYISEGVDTAVIECGIGGEYDCTNLLPQPLTCGVTSLGIDHTAMLGETITEIAWHKAGIFKPASPSKDVYTVASQPDEAMAVLRQRAEASGHTLRPVPRHADIEAATVKLGLAADFQKTNASLAVALTSAHLLALGLPSDTLPDPLDPSAPLPPPFQAGLQNVQWGGRCQVKRQANIIWHLDGGHTIESIKLAADWFASCIQAFNAPASSSSSSSSDNPPSTTPRNQTRILLFNQQTRNANALATALHSALRSILPSTPDHDKAAAPLFDKAIFSTNVTYAARSADQHDAANGSAAARYKPDHFSMNVSAQDIADLTVQNALAQTWAGVDEGCEVGVCASVEEAVRLVRRVGEEQGGKREVVVLVTGSLHLVGGVLEALERV